MPPPKMHRLPIDTTFEPSRCLLFMLASMAASNSRLGSLIWLRDVVVSIAELRVFVCLDNHSSPLATTRVASRTIVMPRQQRCEASAHCCHLHLGERIIDRRCFFFCANRRRSWPKVHHLRWYLLSQQWQNVAKFIVELVVSNVCGFDKGVWNLFI